MSTTIDRITTIEDVIANNQPKKALDVSKISIFHFIISDAQDDVSVTDTTQVDPNRQSVSDTVNVTDAATATSYTPPFKVYFTSTTPESPPLDIDFCEVSFSG